EKCRNFDQFEAKRDNIVHDAASMLSRYSSKTGAPAARRHIDKFTMTESETNLDFKPYIAPEDSVKEFTPKAVILGGLFGILFGAASVYLALKAGLTVSASIPVAVLAISLGRKFFNTTILENNIIQTTASAGESIASGVVFTLPGFLFLSLGANGESVGAP